MKTPLFTAGWMLCTTLAAFSQSPVDLSTHFDRDAVLEENGTGIENALDNEGRRLAATTLPATYADGSPIATQDGRATFRFAPLDQPSLDAVAVNGQVIDVVDGSYSSVDLALLSAPGALASPFGQIEFRYTDSTTDLARFGPVPGWFNSPMAFDHTLYRFTDDSQVENLAAFQTMTDDEAPYVYQEAGNGNAGGTRFVDGTGYVLYRFGELGDLAQATLGVTVGNNFVISIATAYYDPSASTTDGYTVLANSMVLHDGTEHRALGNLKQYDFDIAPFLAEGTGEVYVLLTDATTENGWGPYIQRVSLFTGTVNAFEGVLEPTIDASQATVHALFRTATTNETPYLFDNQGSGPSNRGHRFADGNGSITYRFDLADSVTDATLTLDMANNFVVGLSGPSETVRYANVAAATPEEQTYLVDAGGSNAGADFRFADGTAYMIYQFDLPDDVTTAFAKVHVGNQFIIEAASGEAGEFTVEMDWVAESGEETTDNSNLAVYDIDLTPHLLNNPTKVVRLRLSDGVPSNGWGPFLRGIVIQNTAETAEAVFTTVLEAQTLFGEDIRNEHNKRYYTVDLAAVLQNNPDKVFFVKFTDGSTSDGWGPGIFWMAVHTGPITVQSDRLVFNDLKTTLGDPETYGAGLLHRRYPLNASKTLSTITLPSQPTTEANQVFLLAAALNAATTPTTVELTATRTAAGNVRLTWPATATGYQLQTRTSLDTNPSWSAVTETPQSVGGEWVLELTPSDPTRFYRLAK